ncbi:MAG: YwaF family protein [Bacillales bacterium]|nr:YwaF family protein [Bacillales bacterium]
MMFPSYRRYAGLIDRVNFDFSHIAMIIILILAIGATYFLRGKIKPSSKTDKIIRYTLGSLLLAFHIAFIIWAVFGYMKDFWTTYSWCSVFLFFDVLVLFTKSEKLWKLTAIQAVMGGVLAVLFNYLSPQDEFPSFRYWHYFINHIMIAAAPFYMFNVHRFKLEMKDFVYIIMFTFVLLIPAALLNKVVYSGTANFFYLDHVPSEIQNIFPTNSRFLYLLTLITYCSVGLVIVGSPFWIETLKRKSLVKKVKKYQE